MVDVDLSEGILYILSLDDICVKQLVHITHLPK